ncbi:MAG: hypothetical protein Q9178_007334 [Gyalolechia marmorata]
MTGNPFRPSAKAIEQAAAEEEAKKRTKESAEKRRRKAAEKEDADRQAVSALIEMKAQNKATLGAELDGGTEILDDLEVDRFLGADGVIDSDGDDIFPTDAGKKKAPAKKNAAKKPSNRPLAKENDKQKKQPQQPQQSQQSQRTRSPPSQT